MIDVILGLVLFALPTLAQVIHDPKNVTLFVGQGAHFTCITTGGTFNHWLVNHTSLEQLDNGDFDQSVIFVDGSTILNLTFPARTEYNKTIIQCQVTLRDEGGMYITRLSNTATLLIQGLLSAVSDVKAVKNNTAISVYWSAPFSLSVTGVNHDIWYCVLIHNETEGINVSTHNSSDCDVFTTDTHIMYYSDDDFSPCDDIFVTVIPFNGAGQGEASPNILTNTSLTNVALVTRSITALDRSLCSVVLQLLSFESVCNPVLKEVYGSFPEVELVENMVTMTFPANNLFLTYLQADDRNKNLNLTHKYISTYDVQNIIIENTLRNINMKIEFILNSTARGCFLMFQAPTQPVIFRAIVRTDTSTTLTYSIVDLPPAEYSVLAYDLEYNLLPNQESALELDKPLVVTNQQRLKFSSEIIKKATLHFDGSNVVAECDFLDINGASCIMIGVKTNDRSLIVLNFTRRISLRTETTKNYTFAIFGKNRTHIDQQPTAMEIIDIAIDDNEGTFTTATGIPSTEATDKDIEKKNEHILPIIIVGTVVVALTLVCITVVIVFIVCRHRSKVKHSAGRDVTKNVVYDEIILPSVTPSSQIPTEPNNAYLAFKPSKLVTFDNVAYACSHS